MFAAPPSKAYRGGVRLGHLSSRDQVHLVTMARRPMSEDIATRQRRYLIMMLFRAACFGITVILFVYGFRWWAAIPAAFAIFVPYVAVVYANGGREPANLRGFREYQVNLPERYHLSRPDAPNAGHGTNGTSGNGTSGNGTSESPGDPPRPAAGASGPDDAGTGTGGWRGA